MSHPQLPLWLISLGTFVTQSVSMQAALRFLLQRSIFCYKDRFCWKNDSKSYFTSKSLRLSHVQYLWRPIGYVLSAQEMLDPSLHYSVIHYYLPSIPCQTEWSEMAWMIQRASVLGKWLHPNHVWYTPRPTGYDISTHKKMGPSPHYPVLDYLLESSPCPIKCMIYRERFKEPHHKYLAYWSMIDMMCTHPISCMCSGLDYILTNTIVLHYPVYKYM